MAIAEMRKILLIGESSLREKVVKKLQQLGIFQATPPGKESVADFFQKTEVELESLQENLSRLEEGINFLSQFEEKKFELGFFPTRVVVKPADYNNWVKNFNWKRICQKCQKIQEEIEKTKERIFSLREEYLNLSPWRKLPLALKDLKTSKYVEAQPLIIPQESRPLLFKLTEKVPIHAQILGEVGRKVYILLIFLKDKREHVDQLIHKLKGEKVKLTEEVMPSHRLRKIKQEIENLEKKRKDLLEEAANLTKEKIKLMTLYDHFYDLLQEKKAHLHSRVSRYTFLLEGWVRKEDLPVLKEALTAFNQIEVIIKKPTKKEQSRIPIALSNSRIFKPFELITELYGLPRYVEIDPTPFLAPFFALFLAFCLTDGGYGIILALLAYLIPKKVQVTEGGRKLFSLLFISGLVTIVIGTVTGGLFGVELQKLPEFLLPLKKLALFNPINEPMTFLMIALAMGVIHLLTGIALEMKDKLRRGDVGGAFLDQFTWIVLIIGLLLAFLPQIKGFLSGEGGGLALSLSPGQILELWKKSPLYSRIGSIFTLGAAAILFFFSGRKSKNIGKRLAKGAYEVYGIIQLFADILSYSRLLALGLATSVIATVVNTIAQMAGGIPVLGPVALVLILVLGHLGNLLINCLSGFIHTARLQFVEFFTKFYEGGGKRFEPLKREGRYTIVTEIK